MKHPDTQSFTPAGSAAIPAAAVTPPPVRGPQITRAEIQAAFRDGLNALKRGRLAEAEQLLLLALKRDPNHVAARIDLALVSDRRGDHDSALRELRAAARLDGTRAEAYVNLGAILAEDGRIADALDYLRRASQLDAGMFEVHYDLGLLHYRNGQVEERWLPSTAPWPSSPIVSGALLSRQSSPSAAEARTLTILEARCHAVTPPRGHPLSLGVAYCRADRFADAIRTLGTAVQLVPDYPRAPTTWASPTIGPAGP
jgi:Flp pilus assembly protein TadD